MFKDPESSDYKVAYRYNSLLELGDTRPNLFGLKVATRSPDTYGI